MRLTREDVLKYIEAGKSLSGVDLSGIYLSEWN